MQKARGQVDLDAAVLKTAARNRRSAERQVVNVDGELAEAVAVAVRPLIHPSVPILALPAELETEPDLADLRPLVVVVQSEECHRSPRGWLSTVARPGSLEAEGRPARLGAILVSVYSVEGLPLSLTAEALHGAKGLGLEATRPEMIRQRTSTYTSPTYERVLKQTFELDVTGAASPTPLVTVNPEPKIIGWEVTHALRDGFDRAGDGNAHVDVGSVTETGTTWTGDVVSRGYRVTVAFGSVVGSHTEQQAWVDRWVTALADRVVDGHGRVDSARIVDGGRAIRDGKFWGAEGVVVEVDTRSRRR